eukprot:scaffold12271_cov66-Phaeocystis_antarctica.AAC.1
MLAASSGVCGVVYGDASVGTLRGRPERRGSGLCNLGRRGLAALAPPLFGIRAGSQGFGHGLGNGGGIA